MKANFVPAIGEQLNSVYKRGLNYHGFDIKFFTDKSHFKHNIALQSCYYGMEGVGKNCDLLDNNYRSLIGYPKDNILIGDSGGFQIASFKKKGEKCNIKPIDSLRWQEANCDIGMNLDIPPNLDGNPNHSDFISALKESKENFKLFEKERQNYKMILLNILHGENLAWMEEWYKEVKDFNFDGWAIGMKPPYDPMIQALGFMFLYEKVEFEKDNSKWIHFFGTSGKHVVPTIAYCAHKLNKIEVSYDSSSYNIGSIYRTYYLPFDLGPHLSFGNKFNGNIDRDIKPHNPNLKSLPCSCPVCNSIKDINDLNNEDIYAGTLISLHNMYQYIQYNNLLNSMVREKELFLEYLNKIGISERTKKSIEFIDFALDKGIDAATKKYNQWLIPQHANKSMQVGLFAYNKMGLVKNVS